MQIRSAHTADHPPLTSVLARAFDDDPIMRWVFPGSRTRDRYGEAFFRWSLWRCADQRVTWTTDDLVGAAIWALPDRWQVTLPQLGALVRWTWRGVGWRAPRVLWGFGSIERVHPHDRHLYLAVLGVDPARQGAGVGSALLAPGLELCDREGLPAYLETGKERNLAFYGRHGFRVTGQLRLPRGPAVWSMRRDPRATHGPAPRIATADKLATIGPRQAPPDLCALRMLDQGYPARPAVPAARSGIHWI
jgi:ribosomal protein S18 acetylase RimI-like enzyme